MTDPIPLAEALAHALNTLGIEYSCAIVLISQSDDQSHAASTGDPQRVAKLLYGALSHLIAAPITIEPFCEH